MNDAAFVDEVAGDLYARLLDVHRHSGGAAVIWRWLSDSMDMLALATDATPWPWRAATGSIITALREARAVAALAATEPEQVGRTWTTFVCTGEGAAEALACVLGWEVDGQNAPHASALACLHHALACVRRALLVYTGSGEMTDDVWSAACQSICALHYLAEAQGAPQSVQQIVETFRAALLEREQQMSAS